MVVLRATRKLAGLLPESVGPGDQSDTALGDWYVNRVSVDRQPLLLLVSAASLLAIVVLARDVRSLPGRLAQLVDTRLRAMGIAADLVAAETAAMETVKVGRTCDRSVVGIMVEYARMLPGYLPRGDWSAVDLAVVEARLAESPCYAGRPFEEVVFPVKLVPTLLAERWYAA